MTAFAGQKLPLLLGATDGSKILLSGWFCHVLAQPPVLTLLKNESMSTDAETPSALRSQLPAARRC